MTEPEPGDLVTFDRRRAGTVREVITAAGRRRARILFDDGREAWETYRDLDELEPAAGEQTALGL